MRPTDLALLRVPGVPTVSPDGRIAVVAVSPARPRGRRVPQPAVGGADRRLGAGPAADPRAPGHRAGVLARTAAGWRTCAPSRAGKPQAARAADRRRGAAAAHRPPARAPGRRCGRRTRAGWPTSPGSRAGPVRHRRGRRPRGRAAAADHHAAVPARRRRLPRRPAAARCSSLDLPADFADDTAAAARAGAGHHRGRRLRRRRLAPGRRASWRSSRRGTSAPTATWSATSTRSAPTAPGCAG